MRPAAVIALALACMAVMAPTSPAPAAPSTGSLLIRDVTVVNPAMGTTAQHQDVFVAGNRIVAISPTAAVTEWPFGGTVVDGRSRFVIPGLWDMHVHLLDKSRWAWGSRLAITNGITGFRDPATTRPLTEVHKLRKQVEAGQLLAPRFVTAGPLIDGPPPIFKEFLTVSSPGAMRSTVRKLKDQGADFIKVYARLSRPSFLAAVGQAKQEGLTVAGHVPLALTTAEASDLGMRSIEHVYRHRLSCATAEDAIRRLLIEQSKITYAKNPKRYEALERENWDLGLKTDSSAKCEELGARFARNGTWFVPTMVEMYSRYRPDALVTSLVQQAFRDPRLAYYPPKRVEAWKAGLLDQATWLEQQPDAAQITAMASQEVADRVKMVGDLHRGGARLLAGTDASFNFPLVLVGFSLHEELEMLVQAGLTSTEALQTATSSPAQFLQNRQLGSVAAGQLADLVLLDGNPMEDIRNTRRIRAVLLNGHYLDRAALDGLLAEAAEIARQQ